MSPPPNTPLSLILYLSDVLLKFQLFNSHTSCHNPRPHYPLIIQTVSCETTLQAHRLDDPNLSYICLSIKQIKTDGWLQYTRITRMERVRGNHRERK